MRTIPNSGQSYLELVLELQRAVLQFSEHPCFDSAAFDQLWTQAYALDGIAEQINDLRLFEDLEPQISESRKLLQNLTLQLKGTLAGVPDGELSEGLKRLTKQSFPRAASTYEYSIYKNLLDDYSSREMSVDNSLLEKLPAHFKASFLNDDKLIRTSFKPLLELLSYCDATEAAKLLTTLKAAFNKNDLEPLVAILLARELQAQNLGFKNYFAFKNSSSDISVEEISSIIDDTLRSLRPLVSRIFSVQELNRGNWHRELKAGHEENSANTQSVWEQYLGILSDKHHITFNTRENSALPNAGTVIDIKNRQGSLLGTWQVDLWWRKNKTPGCWVQNIYPRSHKSSGFSFLTFNFGKTISLKEARSLAHELGHATDNLLSPSEMCIESGIHRLPPEVVEIPAILHESMVVDSRIIDLFKIESHEARAISLKSRIKLLLETLLFAKLDLRLHSTPNIQAKDLELIGPEISKEFAFDCPSLDSSFLPYFHHVFDGDHYAAKFYTYLWGDLIYLACLEKQDLQGEYFPQSLGRTNPQKSFSLIAGIPFDKNFVETIFL